VRPLGDQDHCICVASYLLRIGCQDHIQGGVFLLEPVHGDGIVDLHARPAFQKVTRDV
jgi:hypothetical protein